MASSSNHHFKSQTSHLSVKLSQSDQSDHQPPPNKKPKFFHHHPPKFVFKTGIQTTYKFLLQPLRGPLILIRQISSPKLTKTFPTDTQYFKFQIMLHGIVSRMLSQLGIKDATLEDLTLEVSSFAREIANKVSNMGNKVLPMWIDMVQTDYFLFDEREVMEEIERESMVENARSGAARWAVDEMVQRVVFDGGDLINKCDLFG